MDNNDAYIKEQNGGSSQNNDNSANPPNFSGTYPYITGPNAVVTLLQNQNETEPPLSTLQHRPTITKMHVPIINTEFLVVGAGPSGAALASFMGQNGELQSPLLDGFFPVKETSLDQLTSWMLTIIFCRPQGHGDRRCPQHS